jgi:hypothetical protein
MAIREFISIGVPCLLVGLVAGADVNQWRYDQQHDHSTIGDRYDRLKVETGQCIAAKQEWRGLAVKFSDELTHLRDHRSDHVQRMGGVRSRSTRSRA